MSLVDERKFVQRARTTAIPQATARRRSAAQTSARRRSKPQDKRRLAVVEPSPMVEVQELYTLADVARITRRSMRTVEYDRANGKLEVVHVPPGGRSVRVTREELLRYSSLLPTTVEPIPLRKGQS